MLNVSVGRNSALKITLRSEAKLARAPLTPSVHTMEGGQYKQYSWKERTVSTARASQLRSKEQQSKIMPYTSIIAIPIGLV